MYYYLLIVNKNGSLIFDKAFSDKIKLSANESIKIASIFYSMHAISSKLTPNNLIKTSELNLENNGIEVIEAEFMKLVCFQSLTKLKFIFVVDPITSVYDCEIMFKKIYDIYSDFVSKNPFYEVIVYY
jgi:hypothetical protein